MSVVGSVAGSVSGDWMYDDALLHPLHPQSPAGGPARSRRPSQAASDAGVRRLPRPGRGRKAGKAHAELLDSSYLRQIIPTKNRSLLLSTQHRRSRAARTAGNKRSRTPELSSTAPPSWLSNLPARSSGVPHKTMRERWRAMNDKRNGLATESTLDAETQAQMAQEKEELATSMGLTMAELMEMDQAAQGDGDDEAEYKKAFEVRACGGLHVVVGCVRVCCCLCGVRVLTVDTADTCRSLTRMVLATSRPTKCGKSSRTWVSAWTTKKLTK